MRTQQLFIITILDQAPSSRGDNRHVRGGKHATVAGGASPSPRLWGEGQDEGLSTGVPTRGEPPSLRSVDLSPQAGRGEGWPTMPSAAPATYSVIARGPQSKRVSPGRCVAPRSRRRSPFLIAGLISLQSVSLLCASARV